MRRFNAVTDPVIKSILQMPCEFHSYEVGYDSDKIRQKYAKSAAKFNVKVTPGQKNPANGYEIESCSGTVENCFRYLREYIEADYGYTAGQCFNILNAPKTPEFKREFQHFVNWISASSCFDDFVDGVENGDMSDFMKG